MALKKEDKIRLEGLEKTFTMLTSNGIPEDQVMTMMGEQINEFEEITSSKLKIQFGDNPSIELVDLSKDYLRTRFSNPENQVLRAKVEGVSIDVKIFKAEEFTLTNVEVVGALRALADEVEGLSVELTSLKIADVRKLGTDENPVQESAEGESMDESGDEPSDVNEGATDTSEADTDTESEVDTDTDTEEFEDTSESEDDAEEKPEEDTEEESTDDSDELSESAFDGLDNPEDKI